MASSLADLLHDEQDEQERLTEAARDEARRIAEQTLRAFIDDMRVVIRNGDGQMFTIAARAWLAKAGADVGNLIDGRVAMKTGHEMALRRSSR